jgi:hypothetical protein
LIALSLCVLASPQLTVARLSQIASAAHSRYYGDTYIIAVVSGGRSVMGVPTAIMHNCMLTQLRGPIRQVGLRHNLGPAACAASRDPSWRLSTEGTHRIFCLLIISLSRAAAFSNTNCLPNLKICAMMSVFSKKPARGGLKARSEILRLTVGSGTPSLRPAADKLPDSTAETRRDMASRRSTGELPKIERMYFRNRRLLNELE